MEMRLCGEKKPPTFKRDRITIEVSGNVTSGPISNYSESECGVKQQLGE